AQLNSPQRARSGRRGRREARTLCVLCDSSATSAVNLAAAPPPAPPGLAWIAAAAALRRLERGVLLGQPVHLALHLAAFLFEEAADGVRQPRVGDVVGGVHGGRQVAAGDLVLALRAGLDARQAVVD